LVAIGNSEKREEGNRGPKWRRFPPQVSRIETYPAMSGNETYPVKVSVIETYSVKLGNYCSCSAEAGCESVAQLSLVTALSLRGVETTEKSPMLASDLKIFEGVS